MPADNGEEATGDEPVGTDPDTESASAADDAEQLPGVPATRRNRAKSATLWGLVGGFAFLVLAQGYLLVGGELPFRYAGIFPLAAVVAVVAGSITYLTEHRMGAKRRT